jgi:hypothetical protein
LYLPDYHPARVHGDDFVVESAKSPLALLDQPWLEARFPVSWDFDIKPPLIGQDALPACPLERTYLASDRSVHPKVDAVEQFAPPALFD